MERNATKMARIRSSRLVRVHEQQRISPTPNSTVIAIHKLLKFERRRQRKCKISIVLFFTVKILRSKECGWDRMISLMQLAVRLSDI